MIVLNLPWPPSALSPNRRQHWSKLAAAKKAYRKACHLAVLVTKPTDGAQHAWPWMAVELTFHPPDRRSYDRDNLVARCKAGLDGLADALGVDDKQFHSVSASVAEVNRRNPHVRVVITECQRKSTT